MTRPNRPVAATCSSCTVDARLMRGAACVGIGGPSASRPSLMNTTRRSVTWHPEQMNVWCSTPRTATVWSATTFVRMNSAPHAVPSIALTPSRTRTSAHLLLDLAHATLRYHVTLWMTPAPGLRWVDVVAHRTLRALSGTPSTVVPERHQVGCHRDLGLDPAMRRDSQRLMRRRVSSR